EMARRFAMSSEVPSEIAKTFELEFAPDMPPHESKWLRCANFIVRRTSERPNERPSERRRGSAHAERVRGDRARRRYREGGRRAPGFAFPATTSIRVRGRSAHY